MVTATYCEFEPYWSNENKKRFIIQWVAANFNAPAIGFNIPQRFLDMAKDKNITFTNLKLQYNGPAGVVISKISIGYFLVGTSLTVHTYVGTLLATTLDGQVIEFNDMNIPFLWNDGWGTGHTLISTIQSNYAATDDMSIDLIGYVQQRGPEPFTTQPLVPEIPKVTVEGVKFWRR